MPTISFSQALPVLDCELHYRLANSFPDKVPTAGRGPVIFPLVWEDDLQPHPQCWAGAQVDFDNAMVDYLMVSAFDLIKRQ